MFSVKSMVIPLWSFPTILSWEMQIQVLLGGIGLFSSHEKIAR